MLSYRELFFEFNLFIIVFVCSLIGVNVNNVSTFFLFMYDLKSGFPLVSILLAIFCPTFRRNFFLLFRFYLLTGFR